jgi:hypothetical protein
MKDWGFEVELNELEKTEWTYDKRTDETYHTMTCWNNVLVISCMIQNQHMMKF